jgi:hypothetical protein
LGFGDRFGQMPTNPEARSAIAESRNRRLPEIAVVVPNVPAPRFSHAIARHTVHRCARELVQNAGSATGSDSRIRDTGFSDSGSGSGFGFGFGSGFGFGIRIRIRDRDSGSGFRIGIRDRD